MGHHLWAKVWYQHKGSAPSMLSAITHQPSKLMPKHPQPRPRDHTDAARDIARDLAEIASHIGQLKGDANAYLTDPNYTTLRLRLEAAHSAVEAAAVQARRRVRLNEGR